MYNPEDYNVFTDDPDYECDRRMEQIAHIYEEFGLEYYGEQFGKPVYHNENGYFRIDRFTMDDIPYAVLEWCETDGFAYEDSGLVRYDAHPDEVYNEVCCVLGYPYSFSTTNDQTYYMGVDIKNFVNERCVVHHMSKNYLLYSEYEYVYLKNMTTGEQIDLYRFVYEPDLGIIDKNEKFCAIFSDDYMVVYFIETGEIKTVEMQEAWGYYMRQVSDYCFEIRVDGSPKYTVNVKNIIDGESIEKHNN